MRERSFDPKVKAATSVSVTSLAVLVFAAAVAASSPSWGLEMLTNGDFETLPFGDSWVITPAGTTYVTDHQGFNATGLDASGSHALYYSSLPTTTTQIRQTGFNTGVQWQLDFLFACEQVTGTGKDRSLNFAIPHYSAGQINVRIGVNGTLELYKTGTGWYELSSTAINYSVDADDNGSFADAGDTLNVHSLRIVGNYGVSPYYDVYMSAANSADMQLVAANVQAWHNGNPSPFGYAKELFFTGGTTTGGAYAVDQVSLQGKLLAPSTALYNGDFEESPFSDGWVNGNGVASSHRGLTATGLDALGTQSALLQKASGASTDAFYQGNLSIGPQWQMDMLFASGTIASGGTRSLNFTVVSEGGATINILLAPDGTLSAYNLSDKTWHQLFDAAVSFSADGNADGDFADVDDTLNIHSLRIIGNYDTDNPYYDVYLSDANSGELNVIAANVQYWHSAAPADGDCINQVRFAAGASGGVYLVDEVSVVAVPEPSLLVFLLAGGLVLACRFRRKSICRGQF